MFMFDGKKNIIIYHSIMCREKLIFKKPLIAINAAKVMIREIDCR